ncbi:hypothetical protein SUNI508_06234 [Seiridium unicorne]|uniref:Uncharacterized protein n=1 Tax=Seiridium unicorne TaxID=138068 RepID=A0ABR2V2N1_9PEZI
MAEQNEHDLRARARFAQVQACKNKNVVQNYLALSNACGLLQASQQIQGLEERRMESDARNEQRSAQMEELISGIQTALKKSQDQCLAQETLLAELGRGKEDLRKELEAQSQHLQTVVSENKNLMNALNTLRNSTEAWQAKAENKIESLSTPVSTEFTGILTLIRDREADILRLLGVMKLPEMFELLERLRQNPIVAAPHMFDCTHQPPITDGYVAKNNAQANSGQTTLGKESSQNSRNTAPEVAKSNLSVPAKPGHRSSLADEFEHIFNQFATVYRNEPPKDDSGFIEEFLEAHRPRVAELLQNVILEHCPKVKRLHRPKRVGIHKIRLFIDLKYLTYSEFEEVLSRHLDSGDVRLALREERRQRKLWKTHRGGRSLDDGGGNTKRTSMGPKPLH